MSEGVCSQERLRSLSQQLIIFQQWKAVEQQVRTLLKVSQVCINDSHGQIMPDPLDDAQLDPIQQARMHLAIAASASSIVQTLVHLQGPSTYTSHEKEEVSTSIVV